MKGHSKQHIRCIFHGRVQGVGFRYTTLHVAGRYDVAGHVRNMPDGTVELVAEGAPGEIEKFIAEVEKRMERYISHKTVERSNQIAGLEGFDIAF
ncbi:MAG: acylphosphatase [Planctomycetota bacterium]|nr:MAG: acylphosphatase [Planctomycetota bacterium]